jgi:hypothetical protein
LCAGQFKLSRCYLFTILFLSEVIAIIVVFFFAFAFASFALASFAFASFAFAAFAFTAARFFALFGVTTAFLASAWAIALIFGASFQFLLVGDDEDRFAFVGGFFDFQGGFGGARRRRR